MDRAELEERLLDATSREARWDRSFTIGVMGTGAAVTLFGVAITLALTFAGQGASGTLLMLVASTGAITACVFFMMWIAKSAADQAQKTRVALELLLAERDRSEAAKAHQELVHALQSRRRRWW